MKSFELINAPLEGRNLIEASAGTGKTYSITGLYILLLVEKKLKPEDILVVTFTKAATAELRGRVRESITRTLDILRENDKPVGDFEDAIYERYKDKPEAQQSLMQAIKNFDQCLISTIHGFCQKMLDEFAIESNTIVDAELLENASELTKEIAQDFWRKEIVSLDENQWAYVKTKMSIEELIEVSKKFSNEKDFLLLNPNNIYGGFQELQSLIYSTFDELKDMWDASSDYITGLITRNPSLNNKKFSGMESRKHAMSVFLNADTPPMSSTDFEENKLRYFLQSYIDEHRRDETSEPQVVHEFFQLFEHYCKLCEKFLRSYTFHIEKFYDYYIKELPERKKRYNINTFDDFLVNLRDALVKDDGDNELARKMRNRFKAVLIDEFQDTDPVQYEIFDTAFGQSDGLLYYIGDPKQSVYGFRGADIFAYKKVKDKIDHQNRYSMDTNYRSSEAFVNACNYLFKTHKNPFRFDWIEYHKVKAKGRDKRLTTAQGKDAVPIEMSYISDSSGDGKILVPILEKAINISMVNEIKKLIDPANPALIGTEAVDRGRIAVLVRKKKEEREIRDFLIISGIPAIIASSESVFKTEEAKEIALIMEAIANPSDEKIIKRALISRTIGLSAQDIVEINESDTYILNYISIFTKLNEFWQRYGLYYCIDKFLNTVLLFKSVCKSDKNIPSVKLRLLSLEGGERTITNYLHLTEILNHDQLTNNFGMEKTIKHLNDLINDPSESYENEIRLETDEKAVKVLTMHKSKGLEFDIVFCPSLWRNIRIDTYPKYHDPERDHSMTLELIKPSESVNYEQYEAELIAEKMRILYVAVTRARYKAYIYWGDFTKPEISALAYLLHNFDMKNKVGDIKVLEEGSNDLIKVNYYDDNISLDGGQLEIVDGIETEKLSAREFTRELQNPKRIVSYSYLTMGIHNTIVREDPDESEIEDPEENIDVDEELPEDSILAFPAGSTPGLMMHEIFEKADFQSDEVMHIIKESLDRYGFDPENENYLKAIETMYRSVINTPLPDTFNVKLADIPNSKRINEMEFFYPIKTISRESISKAFGMGWDSFYKEYKPYLGQLQDRTVEGFMYGLIDMIFEHNGKYYIVDWKSNRLGLRMSDYRNLLNPMVGSHYILQYHIYTVAVSEYLSSRIAGFDYEQDFGGVLYIFLRMTSPDYPKGTGIFFHKPEKAVLDALKGGE